MESRIHTQFKESKQKTVVAFGRSAIPVLAIFPLFAVASACAVGRASPAQMSTGFPDVTEASQVLPSTNTPAEPSLTSTLMDRTTATPAATEWPAGVWRPVGPGTEPYEISSLAMDPFSPAAIYAGTSGGNGLYKSSDGGNTWKKLSIPDEFAYQTIAMDPVTPGTLYVGVFRKNAIYKSTDGGSTWALANRGIPACGYTCYGVFALAVNPEYPAILYAGIFGLGVFKSADGGGNWTAVNAGLPQGVYVRDLVVDPEYPAVLYAATWGVGIYKTVSGGGYWYQVRYGLTRAAERHVNSLAIDPAATTTLYAGTDGGGVFKTLEGGKTWIGANTGLPGPLQVMDIAVDPASPAMVYAAAMGGGVYKSADGGENWINLGLEGENVTVIAIDPQNPAVLYAGTDDGMYVLRQPAASA
jgi:photosystem II stability/assembly factor-like uncharacterized protein